MTVKISLNSMEKVKTFINEIDKFDGEFSLVSEQSTINAKSMLGIFSIDLTKPMNLKICAKENSLDEILTTLDKYVM